jgi:group I intron endonuclease
MTEDHKRSGIYAIRNLVNGKVYIGSASRFKDRWICHRSSLRLGTHHSRYLQSDWRKYGPDSFAFEILELVPVADLIRVEQGYLDRLRPFKRRGYNLATVAASTTGVERTAEWRAKHSSANKGRKYSPEARANMSAAQKAYWVENPEARAKVSAASKGRKHSPEARAKNAAASRAQMAFPEMRAKISAALMGINRAAFSAEHRAKIAAANRARGPQPPLTPEHRAKIGAANRGKKRTAEARARMSAGRMAQVLLKTTTKDGAK